MMNVIEDYGSNESDANSQQVQANSSATSVASPRQQNYEPPTSIVEEDDEWTNYRKSLIQQTAMYDFSL
jgi:hypothetical protein